jgi:hypothetical protein
VLRALAGTTSNYNQIVEIAKEQQRLFGGTLESNIAGIQGLVVSARASGASLKQLIDLSQRLAVLDPAQGAEGARIALSEALAGDPASLARRYEIPRKELAKLRDESLSVTERLGVVDSFLAKIGITSATVSGSISAQAQALNAGAAAWDRFKISVGAGIAAFGAGASRIAAPILGGYEPEKARLQGQADQLVAPTADFNTYIAGVERIRAANFGLRNSFDILTQQQFLYAQGLISQGTANDAAITKALAMKGVFDQLVVAQDGFGASAAAQAPRIIALASTSDFYRATLQNLITLLNTGAISGPEFITMLTNMEIAQKKEAAATHEAVAAKTAEATGVAAATNAYREQLTAMTEEATAGALNAAQSELLAQKKEQVADSARIAALQLLGAGAAGAQMAVQYAAAENPTQRLIAAQYQLAAAAQYARQFISANQAALDQKFREYNGSAPKNAAQVSADVAAAKARQEYQRATETAAQKEARLRREIGQTAKGSAEYYKKLTELSQVQKATGSGATSAASKQAKAAAAAAKAQASTGSVDEQITKLQAYQATLKQGSAEYYRVQKQIENLQARQGKTAAKSAADQKRDAEELARSREALMTDQELLEKRRAQLAAGNLPEVERNELQKDILDLEKRISDEKQKQVELQQRAAKAAIDAGLAQIEDERARGKETKEAKTAQRVIASATATEEQKAAARLRLREIELEQAKRQMEIAEKIADAGQVAAPGAGAGAPIVGTPQQPLVVEPSKGIRGGPADIAQMAGFATATTQQPLPVAPIAPMPALAAPQDMQRLVDGLVTALQGMAINVYVNGVRTNDYRRELAREAIARGL